ncbi:MAG: hypothetical protein ACHQJ5_02850 [Vicinamibacteria bacterium]
MAAAIVALALALPGVASAGTVTFGSSTPIVTPALGSAAPYPSTIAVGGFVGPLTDVNVTLSHLQHPSETDLTVLLVGPGGQRTILMSGAGSFPGSPPDETLTFDDEAPTSLPCGSLTPIPSGSYKPTRGTCDPHPEAFPPPAPAGPYPLALSVFDGTTANGDWKLFVIDELAGDSGVIAGGWSISITAPTDLTLPETTISKGPKNKTKKKTATFEFASSEAGSTFACRLDGNLGFSPCSSPQTVRRIGPGKHTFEVRATDQDGNTETAPAVDSWKVKRKR